MINVMLCLLLTLAAYLWFTSPCCRKINFSKWLSVLCDADNIFRLCSHQCIGYGKIYLKPTLKQSIQTDNVPSNWKQSKHHESLSFGSRVESQLFPASLLPLVLFRFGFPLLLDHSTGASSLSCIPKLQSREWNSRVVVCMDDPQSWRQSFLCLLTYFVHHL